MDQSSGEVLSALMLFNVVVKKGWDYEGNCTGKMHLEVEKKRGDFHMETFIFEQVKLIPPLDNQSLPKLHMSIFWVPSYK